MDQEDDDRFFKEYAITDLSRYKHGQIGLRWRVEKEVLSGKGELICANKTCSAKDGLSSFEVNFAHGGDRLQKNTLVKVRLCKPCGDKMAYYRKVLHAHEERARRKEEKRKKKKKRRREDAEGSDQENSDEDAANPMAEADGSKTQGTDGADPKPANPWAQPPPQEIEKTRDEEFDQYFKDMFS